MQPLPELRRDDLRVEYCQLPIADCGREGRANLALLVLLSRWVGGRYNTAEV
jgi:hypothetical protein